jgi:hypothetical protein
MCLHKCLYNMNNYYLFYSLCLCSMLCMMYIYIQLGTNGTPEMYLGYCPKPLVSKSQSKSQFVNGTNSYDDGFAQASMYYYNKAYAIFIEGTSNNMTSFASIQQDMRVHGYRDIASLQYSLFVFEMQKNNPNRTSTDKTIMYCGDHFYIRVDSNPSYYVCMEDDSKNGPMTVSNSGKKAVFVLYNKYTNPQKDPQHGPAADVNTQLFWLGKNARVGLLRDNDRRFSTLIGTGSEMPSQHYYVSLYHKT